MAPERRSLVTRHMALEPVEERHTAGIFAAANASRDHLTPWMPWLPGLTEKRIHGLNLEAADDWKAGRGFAYAMVEQGRVIGIVSLAVAHGGVGELGYWVAAADAGKGRAIEAGLAVLRFAFEVLGLYRVELRAGVENSRSLRVAEKLGFTREGTLRNGLDGTEGPFDTHIFGITPEDWTAGESQPAN